MKNPSSKSIQQIDINDLIKDYQISNVVMLTRYFCDIWRDLSYRSSEKEKGFDKHIFSQYYNLPGIINDRLFSVLDTDHNGYLDIKEFIEGMVTLFSESFSKLVKFIFKLYDFDHDGKISKEDVRVVLSYVPLEQKREKYKMRYENQNFKDRVDSQQELFEMLNQILKNKQSLNEEEFIKVI